MTPIDWNPQTVVRGAAAQALLDRAARDVGPGGLPSCAVVVLRDGEVLLDAVVGAPHDATYLLWSVSKGLFSALVGALVGDGTIDITLHVRDVLPWFTGDGKQDVRVSHLLLHTAGLALAPLHPLEGGDPQRRRARMQTWRTTSEPGTRSHYHQTAAHWVLASLVEELTGSTVAEQFRELVAEPLGLSSLTFAPDPADPRRQPGAAVGEPTPDEVLTGLLAQGIDVRAMVASADIDTLLGYEAPDVLRVGSPGAGAVGPVREVAGVYAALLAGRPDVWPEDVRRDLVGQVHCTLPDHGLGMASNRTLGFVVAGDDGAAGMRGLPSTLGPRVFGQDGVAGQVAWADPDTGLVFVHATNGLHRDPLWWWARTGELNELAARIARS